MNNSTGLTPVQGPSILACMIVTSLSQLSHLTSSAPSSGWRPVKTLTCIPSFCCKSGSNSRSNRKTQPWYWQATNNITRRSKKTEKQNRIDKTHRKRTAGKNKEQVSLWEAPHLQDLIQNHSKYSNTPKCWNSKKEFSFIEQPSSPL